MINQKMQNHYEVLGIDLNTTQEEIKMAYRGLAKKYHPDLNNVSDSNEKMKKINLAYEVLSNPTKRAEYDSSLNSQEQEDLERRVRNGYNPYDFREEKFDYEMFEHFMSIIEEAKMTPLNKTDLIKAPFFLVYDGIKGRVKERIRVHKKKKSLFREILENK